MLLFSSFISLFFISLVLISILLRDLCISYSDGGSAPKERGRSPAIDRKRTQVLYVGVHMPLLVGRCMFSGDFFENESAFRSESGSIC